MEGISDKEIILDENTESNELIEKTPLSEVNGNSLDLIEKEKSDEKTEKSIIPYIVEFRYNIEDLRKHGEELTSTFLPADCPSQLSEYCRELEAFDPRAPKGKLKQTSAVDAHQKWAANKPIPYRNDTLPTHSDASKQQYALRSLLGITKPEEKESTTEGDTRLNDRGTNNLKALLGGGGFSTPGSGGITVSDSGFPIVHMIAQPRAAASDGAPAHSIPYKQASNTATTSVPVNTGRFANLSKQTTPVSYSNPRPNPPPRTQQSQSHSQPHSLGQSLQGHESAAAQREREIFERERRAIQQERERGKEQQTCPELPQQSVASSIKPAGPPQTFVSYHDECDALMDELMSGSQREERKAPQTATLPPPAPVPAKPSQVPPFSAGAMSTQSYLASIDLTSLLAPVGPTNTQRAFQPSPAPKSDAASFRSMPAADPWGPPGLGAPGLGSFSPLIVPSPWGAPQTSSSLPSSAHASQSSFASTTHTAVHHPVAAEEPGLDPRVTGMLMQLGDDLGVQRPKATPPAAQGSKAPIETAPVPVPASASGLTFMAPLPPPSSTKPLPLPEQPLPSPALGLGQVDSTTAGRKMSKIDVKQLFSLNSTTPSTTTSLPKPPQAATPSKPTSFAFHSPQPQSSSRQASYDEQDSGGGSGRGRITIGTGHSPQPTLTNSGGSGSGSGSSGKPSTVRMSAASRMRLQQISAGKDKAVPPPISSSQTSKTPITQKITHNIGALTVTATPPTTTTSKHTISTQPPTQTLTTITTTTTNTTNTTNTAAGTVEGGTRNMKKIDVRSLFA